MIKSKEDLKYYIEQDRIMNKEKQCAPYLFLLQKNWNYLVYLRKCEYYSNRGGVLSKIPACYYKARKEMLGGKLGFSIPINTCEEGLCLHHYGSIVVSTQAKVGKNCYMVGDVFIGQTGKPGAPVLGDNVGIGAGAKVIGPVHVGSNVRIGANAVVTKDIESNVKVAGVPAKVISKFEA